MAVVMRSLLKLEVTGKGEGALSRTECSSVCPAQAVSTRHLKKSLVGKLDGEEVTSGRDRRLDPWRLRRMAKPSPWSSCC